ncbi:ergot alkaloid biosynthesis protein [Pelagibius litoralis]|uniref:Ergot alkaloid biosynthesis protein n=1 Tax=Pelagibius litoralis TaxID=374515 RepID=A0A967C236_9PROT|nr:ergot alkaloid biosynthesis protein [Pelagibius litoralis]NIA68641.1 ergot alkaloid biosynthesis protein [Pelagibius litoralis]
MQGEILIIGARGKTGSRLAVHLAGMGAPTRRAARTADRPGEVSFDWARPETFGTAFEGIHAAYLVAPTDRADHAEVMVPAIEQALKLGVRRFVLLSASSLEAGGPMMGAVHSVLREVAPEWCVLRPTWFMQNFSEQQHLPTIRDENAIYTAAGRGRVPFIDADDIAAAAAGALTAEYAPNTDVILTGPEPLSYDDVAERLSSRLVRTIHHVGMSYEDFMARLMGNGFDKVYAKALADMDEAISRGSEDRVTDGVQRLAGRSPRDFDAFVAENEAVWR